MIRIDKNGIWFYKGNEMLRTDIVNLFYDHLSIDESGRYVIELGNDRCTIDVEDTPYIVKAVYKKDANIEIVLNDSKRELLDPKSLHVGRDNIMYCSVRDGKFKARFSRAAYYQISGFIKYESDKGAFYLSINENTCYINGSC
ncbi:MAG: DUF1285 domain-containing protein [Deltaproteobacteria bacterium]|nr:DUF1285 domain-containing protein [Deltaproteobacteria bacterium]